MGRGIDAMAPMAIMFGFLSLVIPFFIAFIEHDWSMATRHTASAIGSLAFAWGLMTVFKVTK